MKVKIIIFILCQLVFETCFAQIDTIIWQNCFGVDQGFNEPNAVAEFRNGYLFGIYLREDGPGVSNFHGSADTWIICSDKTGNIIWERCYGGSKADGPVKIINIDDEKYYLLNYSFSRDGDVQNGRNGEFWVVKIDDSGNIIWENSYGGATAGEVLMDAILLPDKGLILMGKILSAGGDITKYFGKDDTWICRIDSSGSIVWQKTFGNQFNDIGYKIKLTETNTVLCIGAYEKSGGMIDCSKIEDYNYDVWIFEIDLKGTLLNQWCFGGTKHDQGMDITDLNDGMVFLAVTNSIDGDVNGYHGYSWSELYDIWAVKIDYTGNIIWQNCLGGSSEESPQFLSNLNDHGFIIIGQSSSFDGDVTGNHSLYDFYSDIWVVKLSSEGQLEWNHCFGGEGNEGFFWGLHSVLKVDDYNYIIGADANYLDQDVQCDLFPNDLQNNAWLFEIKDCDYYFPVVPSITSGPDTLCSTSNPISSYALNQVLWAEGYEWSLDPESAGIIISDSTSVHITWNPQFEGLATITARSYNDCGYSAWSEPKFTKVYPCMGVNEHGGIKAWGQGSLVIWPNPASAGLSVKVLGLSSGNNSSSSILQPSLVIYDIFGRTAAAPCLLVPRSPSPRDGGWSWQLDVSALPPGIYLAVARDEPRIIGTGKFVVVR